MHHIIYHFYASIKHLVKGLTCRSNVMEGGDVRFTVYVGEEKNVYIVEESAV